MSGPATRDGSNRRRRILRAGMICLSVIALLAAMLVAWQWFAGRTALETARADLEAAAPGPADEARFPVVTSPNEAALRIEQAVIDLGFGIELVPRRSGKSGPVPWELDGLSSWVARESERDTASPPPPLLEQALQARTGSLAALRTALAEGAGAAWESSGPTMHLQMSITHHLRLTRVLLADALAAHHRGDTATLTADVEAAWRLQELLAPRPEIIGQLMRIGEAKLIAGIMRHVEGLPVGAGRRLDPEPFRHALRHAAFAEVRTLLRTAAGPGGEAGALGVADGAGPVATWLMRPMLRHALAARVQDAINLSRALDDPSGCGQRPAAEAFEPPGFLAMMRGQEIAPTIGGGLLMRMDRLAIHFELTQRVLAVKAARDQSVPPAWPDDLPGGATSACPAVTWKYSRPEPATARIEAASWTAWLRDENERSSTSWTGALPPAEH